jgi:beta-ribofuranosylaminobenzene 5'-phosphate synthase
VAGGNISRSETARPVMVTISAPSRIHINSIDMSGTLGRFGIGIGFAIQEPRVKVTMRSADRDAVEGDFRELAESLLETLRRSLPSSIRCNLTCRSDIPRHCGLGSETMTSLAIGEAYSLLSSDQSNMLRIAAAVQCSVHSGVGLSAYTDGGFALDSGYTKASLDAKAPVDRIVRLPMPEQWRIIIARVDGSGFASQDTEREFWEQNRKTVPEEESAHLARVTLSQLLPSLVHADFQGFCAATAALATGGFKKHEFRFHGPTIQDAIAKVSALGAPLVGMTSGGPTLYTFAPDQQSAMELSKGMTSALGVDPTAVWITKGDNTGRVRVFDAS